jgi:hypothetical protein
MVNTVSSPSEVFPSPSTSSSSSSTPSSWYYRPKGGRLKGKRVLDMDIAYPPARTQIGPLYAEGSGNENSVMADATRHQGYTHCHPFHRPIPDLWPKSRRDAWLQHPHGEMILHNIHRMVHGHRMPGQLVDRLNSGCGAGKICQYISRTTGYYFDVRRRGWLYFRDGPQKSEDEKEACQVCGTQLHKYDKDQDKNNDEAIDQLQCGHSRTCLGGVYNEDRDRCMCLTTQRDTREDMNDTYGTEEGNRHYDSSANGNLSTVHKYANAMLAAVTVIMLIIFVITWINFKKHKKDYEDFRNHHMEQHKMWLQGQNRRKKQNGVSSYPRVKEEETL